MTQRRLILASGSPQRERLLREAGYRFECIVPVDDEPIPDRFPDATAYVEHTAWLKARAIAQRIDCGDVLAADTSVVLDGRVIGKAVDRAHARQILSSLSGTRHQVVTGVCIWRRPDDWWLGGVDVTSLEMRSLTTSELDSYVASDRWVGKAGAYGIQDPDPYVSIIAGSHSNVVGLPLELVGQLFSQCQIAPNTDP